MLRRAPVILFVSFGLFLSAALFSTAPALANQLDRPRDPVVMSGAQLAGLLGTRPDLVVGFRHDGGWVRIPVQVDERASVDFTTIYHVTFHDFLIPSGFKVLTYTDPSTWAGADPDPAFDADDELVFMAREAGDERATTSQPPGTVPGSGVEVAVANPLNGRVGYVYLFRSDGSLGRGPWTDPVTNSFFLLPNGEPYRGKYNTKQGPNPENTQITSANYSLHFSDRWRCDAMRITAPGASGIDILDDRKIRYNPTTCVRSERRFSFGEGAMMFSRQGPVRALRGYCGANSGPTTYRVHMFYDQREDVVTTLRLHPTTAGLMDFFDYAPAATGMTYSNDLNPAGVVIDGSQDQVKPGPLLWEMVTGPQGTLVMTQMIRTDIPLFTYTSYYQDASPAPNAQCSGDSSEYGASGVRLTDPTPNTDPLLDHLFGRHYNFEYTRVIAYDGPGKDAAFARDRMQEARRPLTTAVQSYALSALTAATGGPTSPEFRLAIGPQPVRGQGKLDLALPAEGDVGLQILDVTGRSVATLARGRLAAGPHEFALPADGLRAGVYFARARLDGHGERVVRFVVLP